MKIIRKIFACILVAAVMCSSIATVGAIDYILKLDDIKPKAGGTLDFSEISNAIKSGNKYYVEIELGTDTNLDKYSIALLKDNGLEVNLKNLVPTGVSGLTYNVTIPADQVAKMNNSSFDFGTVIHQTAEDCNIIVGNTIIDCVIAKDSYIIMPAAKGNFGFEYKLEFDAGSKDYKYLYYIDDAGRFYDNTSNLINKNGTITIKMSHASAYILTAEKFSSDAVGGSSGGSSSSGSSESSSISYNGLYFYENEDGTLSVSGLADETLTEIVIPEKVDDKVVTKIGHYAFSLSNIESIVIPNSVTEIEEEAFFGCTNLKDVTIGKSVKRIDVIAFEGCTSLTSIVLPSSITFISLDIFRGCTSLTDIYYEGTEEQWKEIKYCLLAAATPNGGTLGDGPDPNEFGLNGKTPQEVFEILIGDAKIHYNYAPETPDDSEDNKSEDTKPDEFESNGVAAVADDGIIPDGAVFSVEPKSSNESNTQFSYEINFTLNGEKIQPNGYVTICIPIPEELIGMAIYVYRVEDNGGYTRLRREPADEGYVVFKTNHFSEYILTSEPIYADNDDNNNNDDDDNDYNDSTEENSNNNSNSGSENVKNPDTGFKGFSLTMGLIALASAAVVVSRKRK